MEYSVLDVFTGLTDMIKTSLSDPHAILHASIQENLFRLLNTRAGSVTHMSDYGMPDLSNPYIASSTKMQNLIQLLQVTIKKYEPRLKQIAIQPLTRNPHHSTLQLLICGETMRNTQLKLHIYFSPEKIVEVLRE